MNADRLKREWMQFKGDLQKKWSEFTDDDLQEIAWNYDHLSAAFRNGMAIRSVR